MRDILREFVEVGIVLCKRHPVLRPSEDFDAVVGIQPHSRLVALLLRTSATGSRDSGTGL